MDTRLQRALGDRSVVAAAVSLPLSGRHSFLVDLELEVSAVLPKLPLAMGVHGRVRIHASLDVTVQLPSLVESFGRTFLERGNLSVHGIPVRISASMRASGRLGPPEGARTSLCVLWCLNVWAGRWTSHSVGANAIALQTQPIPRLTVGHAEGGIRDEGLRIRPVRNVNAVGNVKLWVESKTNSPLLGDELPETELEDCRSVLANDFPCLLDEQPETREDVILGQLA
mmetsp:Transcript_34101/g.90937  ORF Transcript_34101/g.90937 Transcript_34101/m.90937 type:complete len:227 (+) Transcript_34101:1094-1774(+)